MSPDENSQQPSESAPDEAAPTPASEVPAQPAVEPDAPLFGMPELDVSLREGEQGRERRDES